MEELVRALVGGFLGGLFIAMCIGIYKLFGYLMNSAVSSKNTIKCPSCKAVISDDDFSWGKCKVCEYDLSDFDKEIK